MTKVQFGNKVLAWLGSVTLEFYLMHGVFVELFGFNFLDIAKSAYYIRAVPLYIAAVLACSVIATLLFRWILGILTAPLRNQGSPLRRERIRSFAREWKRRKAEAAEKAGPLRKLTVPVIAVLSMFGFYLLLTSGGNERIRVMNGVEFRIPDHFVREYTDTRYGIWKYEGTDKNISNLVLDAEIRDGKARHFKTVEEVQAECDWMTETELYINPNGIRMIRGFTEYNGNRERRYYIETNEAVMMMCMNENERYYNTEDCEAVLLQVAENARPVH